MTVTWVLSFLFGSGVFFTAGGYVIKRFKAIEKKNEAVCLGVQALLRNELLTAYNKYTEKGYAPIFAKENFENMWTQYHNLGVNGVMDEVREKFMKLPDKEVDHNESN